MVLVNRLALGALLLAHCSSSNAADEVNPIANGDFEMASPVRVGPDRWNERSFGVNSHTFDYPVPGMSGSGARVTVSTHESGRAGWFFDAVPLPPGLYRYSDAYLSDRQSVAIGKFEDGAGRVTSRQLRAAPASSSWAALRFSFTMPVTATKMTILRAIGGVGSLTIDDAAIVAQSVFDRGAVTFRFDDGRASHHAIAAPKLEQLGLAGTFYVISRRTADLGYPGYMSVAQVQDLAGRGHEIAAHTRTHVHLTQLGPSRRQQEIAGSRQDLQSWNVGPVLAFAYPFGEYDAATLQAVKDAGFTSAAATHTGWVSPASDPHRLEHRSVTGETTLGEAKGWVDTAAAERRWLILTFHGIDGSGEYYSCSPALFRSIVDYVKQKRIPVVTASQGRPSLGE